MKKQEVLNELKKSKEKFFTIDKIASILSKNGNFNKNTAKEYANELIKEGEIVLTARSKYAFPEDAGIVKGRVQANAKGFAFVCLEKGEDVFVPKNALNGAIQDDYVLCKLNFRKGKNGFKNKNRNSDNFRSQVSGEIVKILKREIVNLVGYYQEKQTYIAVIPDDLRICREVFIPKDKTANAQNGQKVVVKITSYPENAQDVAMGEVVEILGDADSFKVSTLSVIRAFGITEVFPKNVLEEATRVATKISKSELEGREDFRNNLVFTVDGEDARDFDDAISLIVDKDGFYHLQVHIADVGHYVKRNGVIDAEAFNRGTSVYFPDFVVPMLPVSLSNNMCSLNPNEDRLTLSCLMKIDKKGNLLDYKICEGVINSKARMTYTNVTKILNNDTEMCKKYHFLTKMLGEMAELTKILIERRDKMGNIDFDLPETQIVVNDKGEVVELSKKPRTLADRLIEQFMLMANETVAKHALKNNLPFVFRIHEQPLPEKVNSFSEFIAGMGLKFNISAENVKPKDFQELLQKIENEPYSNVVRKVMLRSMQKARYFPECVGHFGLACKDYCHFTSPIRRYPDLTIHRILKDEINKKRVNYDELENFVSQSSDRSSWTEKRADEAEREVDDLKKAEYMQHHIGEIFDAIISGVTESGIFVELENTVEGMVLKEFLPQDHYYFDEKQLALIGKKNAFRLGEELSVKVSDVDLILRRVNFTFINKEPNGIYLYKKQIKKI